MKRLRKIRDYIRREFSPWLLRDLITEWRDCVCYDGDWFRAHIERARTAWAWFCRSGKWDEMGKILFLVAMIVMGAMLTGALVRSAQAAGEPENEPEPKSEIVLPSDSGIYLEPVPLDCEPTWEV